MKGWLRMKQKTDRGENLTNAAKAYIEAHISEKYSLEKMSGALFVSARHLMRVFREYTGMTPLNYHHLIRCRKAGELLSGTDLSISEIGEAVGFESSSHFSHIFRETEGCTPTEYRAKCRALRQESLPADEGALDSLPDGETGSAAEIPKK